MKHLQGKVALVTGATRGLGKGIAIGLGEAGATVYITGRSLETSSVVEQNIRGTLLETQQAVERAGGVCIPVQVDHGDDQQVRALFEQIDQEQGGQLDILVNNVFSGVQALANAYGNPFWQEDFALWDAVNQVGLRSHYVASILATRLMSQRGEGLICTFSSWGGLSYIFGAAYGAGKAACDRLAADMSVELKPQNITSVAIWPGIVGTEQITKFAENQAGDADSRHGVMARKINWETPLFTGRAIASLAADPHKMRYTGKVQIVAELAQRYNFNDQEGNRPVSLRSLRFLLLAAFPKLSPYAWLIPDLKIPWIILLWTVLASPKI